MRWASCARITARERVTTLEVQRDGTYRAERALGRGWVDLPVVGTRAWPRVACTRLMGVP